MASSKKNVHVLVYFICGICIFFAVVFVKQFSPIHITRTKPKPTTCDDTVKTYLVQGNSMSPMIEDGAIVEGIIDYYTCDGRMPHRGDVVILEDSAVTGPYIKKIGATPGDEISITESGTLVVEKKELQNTHGELYFFTQKEWEFMSIYIRNAKLQNDAYLVFGDNTRNSRDSRKIGALSKSAFKAKVIKINDTVISE